MAESILLKGVLIGLLFGLPVGAVGAMTAQRTLQYGPGAGILTGLGSSAADCCYACISAFGLTFVSGFLLRHQAVIHVLGGGLVLFLGVSMLRRRPDMAAAQNKRTSLGAMFFSSFAVGVANPAAILTFLFAFSYFEIAGPLRFGGGVQLVLGVLLGTLAWWLLLTGAVCLLKNKFDERCLRRLNRIFGAALCLFGLAVFVRIFLL